MLENYRENVEFVIILFTLISMDLSIQFSTSLYNYIKTRKIYFQLSHDEINILVSSLKLILYQNVYLTNRSTINDYVM